MIHRDLKGSFDENARLYDSIRPTYPTEVFDYIGETARLPANAQLLEIGPGTGQATLPFAQQGYQITGVELGQNLAVLACQKLIDYPNVHIINDSFEETLFDNGQFDLVYSATAFHWIHPDLKFTKTFKLLKPTGYLAIIHTVHVSDEKGDEFFHASQPIYDRYQSENVSKFNIANESPKPPFVSSIKPNPLDEALFKKPDFKVFPMICTYTSDEYIDLLKTYSPTSAMDTNRRKSFLDEIRDLINTQFGGKLDKSYAISLTMAQKKI